MPSRIFSRAERARVTLGQKFFIVFLDELGNFKHFDTYFFFGDFWAKKSPIWRSGARQWRQNAKMAKSWELRGAQTHPL